MIPPDVLVTAACTSRSFAPVVVSATVPAPPAVTAAPIVSTPVVAVRLMLPPLPVVIAPVVVRAPVLFTVTSVPGVCVIPVTVRVPAVSVRAMAPLVLFVAVKLPTVFAHSASGRPPRWWSAGQWSRTCPPRSP